MVQAQTKSIDVEKSNIHWVGKKFLGQHEGILKFSKGDLHFEEEKLVGGSFLVDMTTISTTDLEGSSKQKLDRHLKSEDFFDVEKFPSSQLFIKETKENQTGIYWVKADITIKGITKEVQFSMDVKEKEASVDLKFDRTDFGIQYASKNFFKNIGDKFIEDIFYLEVFMVFK